MPARRRANATTAMNPPRGAALGPVPEGGGGGMPQAPDGHGGLDQQRAHAALARLGDPSSMLAFPRAPLAGDEAQVGLDLMRVREASGVIERGHERGGRDRPNARVSACDRSPKNTEIGSPPTTSENVPPPMGPSGRRGTCWRRRTS